ncbi:unnamed protein product [Pseudo-nitzschia multistriata]|uniref:Peptidase M11 gametolysin domain-containing protein n=1 Tax=Pseudo-nitzschia multistriata TaxID=183589 RepID=A0A448ZMI8_9STRA|nr:unnamed protein product [Pseudo-nitzschia multistriata]
MNNFVLLQFRLLTAFSMAIAAAASTTALRGSEQTLPASETSSLRNGRSLRRRLEVHTPTTCRLFLDEIAYKTKGPSPDEDPRVATARRETESKADRPKAEDPLVLDDPLDGDRWICEISSPEESARIGWQLVEIDGLERAVGVDASSLKSGTSVLTIGRAIIEDVDTNPRMYIPAGSILDLRTEGGIGTEGTSMRNSQDLLAGTQLAGTRVETREGKAGSGKKSLTVLAVRVIDAKGRAPDAGLKQLENDIFDDEVCLRSQIEACSHGKLSIEPFSGRTKTNVAINRGVVNLVLDSHDISADNDYNTLLGAAMKASQAKLGDLINSKEFDLVMMCMPPGTLKGGAEWLAHAYSNGKMSFYNNSCSPVSMQLHEIGHNLGLAHSGDERTTYGDKSGLMGSSNDLDDIRMCYNPAKSYQLGWYDEKVKTINPISNNKPDLPVRQFTLRGVADYNAKAVDDALVVLRLEQTDLVPDYYVGYNRRDGANSDVMEDWDKVTIVRKDSGSPSEYGRSTKVASLYVGQSYRIKSFNGQSKRTVEVKFLGLRNGFGDAVVKVTDLRNSPPSTNGAKAPPCRMHYVDVKADLYPDDNAWYIAKEDYVNGKLVETAVAAGEPILEAYGTSRTKVCLPYNAKYRFVVYDHFGDGLLQGDKGYYRVADATGKVLFKSDDLTPFKHVVQPISVGSCEDMNGGRLKWKKNKIKTCAWVAKNKKCNRKYGRYKTPLKKICSRSCGVCGK